jgi:hypothetical protein
MANRHSNKKLRAEIRARMESTGETYQQARARILARVRATNEPRTDLVAVSYFGLPGTLATVETAAGEVMFAFIPSSTLWGRGYPDPFPLSFFRGHAVPRGVQ